MGSLFAGPPVREHLLWPNGLTAFASFPHQGETLWTVGCGETIVRSLFSPPRTPPFLFRFLAESLISARCESVIERPNLQGRRGNLTGADAGCGPLPDKRRLTSNVYRILHTVYNPLLITYIPATIFVKDFLSARGALSLVSTLCRNIPWGHSQGVSTRGAFRG